MMWKVGGRLERKETGHDSMPCTLQLALDMIQILHSSGPEALWYSSVKSTTNYPC